MKVRFRSACAHLLLAAAVALATEATLGASRQVPVPEIDGGSISAGLGLLAAGVLMLRARRSK